MANSCCKRIIISSLEETIELGRQLGSNALPGDIITLSGDLGAGKTTLTQAIGKGLEVPDDCYITSPTFSLLHEYPGRLMLYHMDLYRLSGEEEFIDLGFEEYLYGSGLTVIEWPDRLSTVMPEDRLHIELTIIDETSRSAELIGYGNMADRLSSFLC
jgi:tRNA threonylcarbamoyladenosine biosynthesis protein TsaE